MRDEIFTIPALENETLLSAMERAGLKAPSRCKSGSCGFCHSRLISGEYHVNKEHEYRRLADFKFGFIHPCCTYPESDMEIDVPPFNVGGNQ
jgi:ferredoxin